MIYASFCPNVKALSFPTNEDGNKVLSHGNSAHWHNCTESTTQDENGNDYTVYTKASEKSMAIVHCEEIPDYLSGCTLYQLPNQLDDAKQKAIDEGIQWEMIPQIAGNEYY